VDIQVPGKLDIHDSPGNVVVEVGIRCGVYLLLDRVHVPLLAIRNPRDSEKLQVSRQSSLGYVFTFLLEPLLKLFLAVDLFVFQDVDDESSSGFLTGQRFLLSNGVPLLVLLYIVGVKNKVEIWKIDRVLTKAGGGITL